MKNEKPLYGLIMHAVSEIGGRVFRSNTGLLYTADGRPCRVGLVTGGSDLIGWVPCEVRAAMIAVFTAIEVKSAKGILSEEQERFLERVAESGGIAICAYSVDDVLEAITNYRESVRYGFQRP